MASDVLYEYESILMGKQKIFLLSFSEQTPDKRKAFKEVWQYAIGKILRWTPEDALQNMDKTVMNKLKLDRTLKCIGVNANSRLDFREILSYVYPGRITNSMEERTREEFERVLKIGKWQYLDDPELSRFHKGFFSGEDGAERAAVCLNLAVDLYLGDMSMRDRYEFFADKDRSVPFITKLKLYPVMKNFYENPLDFYHYSIPIEQKDMMVYYEMRIREAAESAAKKLGIIKRVRNTKKSS